MADLQYQPQGVENDETIKLGNAIRNMDGEPYFSVQSNESLLM